MTNGSTAPASTADTTPGDLWDAAERLRVVRRAHERFLALWAVDRLLTDPAAAARAWADGDAAGTGGADELAATSDNQAGAPEPWRRIFRLGRLDD